MKLSLLVICLVSNTLFSAAPVLVVKRTRCKDFAATTMQNGLYLFYIKNFHINEIQYIMSFSADPTYLWVTKDCKKPG